MNHGRGAILVGDGLHRRSPDVLEEGRVIQVELTKPMTSGDSGFVLYLEDAPKDREVTTEDAVLVCLHCMIEHHPEAATGLDLAKEHGLAVYSTKDESWHPGVRELE